MQNNKNLNSQTAVNVFLELLEKSPAKSNSFYLRYFDSDYLLKFLKTSFLDLKEKTKYLPLISLPINSKDLKYWGTEDKYRDFLNDGDSMSIFRLIISEYSGINFALKNYPMANKGEDIKKNQLNLKKTILFLIEEGVDIFSKVPLNKFKKQLQPCESNLVILLRQNDSEINSAILDSCKKNNINLYDYLTNDNIIIYNKQKRTFDEISILNVLKNSNIYITPNGIINKHSSEKERE